MDRKKIVTILIVIATVILAGVAIFTAIRLYQLRQEAVAPTAPIPVPAAQQVSTEDCHTIKFILDYYDQYGRIIRQQANQLRALDEKYRYLSPNMGDFGDMSTLEGVRQAVLGFYNYYCVQNQPTPTGTPSPTGPEITSCTAITLEIGGEPSPSPTPTTSPTQSPTSTPSPTKTPIGGSSAKTATPKPTTSTSATPQPELPDSGVALPSVVGLVIGSLLLVLSLLLAL